MSNNLTVGGAFSAATKSFDIQHPDPAKSTDWRLKHWCIEGDTPGGGLMYRKTIEMEASTQTFQMPDWFTHLAKDVVCMVTPFKHFGSGWGEVLEDKKTIEVHVTTLGSWHVLILASRSDMCAMCCGLDVEYQT